MNLKREYKSREKYERRTDWLDIFYFHRKYIRNGRLPFYEEDITWLHSYIKRHKEALSIIELGVYQDRDRKNIEEIYIKFKNDNMLCVTIGKGYHFNCLLTDLMSVGGIQNIKRMREKRETNEKPESKRVGTKR